jgi:hypothetical protein
MPLQATSGAASYDAFGGGAAVAPKYIEDFFQIWLRTGTGSSATVTTGLNASINKSLVWTKSRSAATNHKLTDTVRGATKALSSNTTSAEATDSQGLTAFGSTGYTIGTNTDYNNSGATYVDWQWLATPKFFDVVTYTGNGTTQNIPHNLAGTVGTLIVKRTDTGGTNWLTYHRSLPTNEALALNTTQASSEYFTPTIFGNNTVSVAPTSTQFTVGNFSAVNASGGTYVAYLFAHNAGGFGLTGTDNVISCGSYTGNGSATGPVVDLGYEPQWVLVKRASGSTGQWRIFDNMRGLNADGGGAVLFPNLADAEEAASSYTNKLNLTATGFRILANNTDTNASGSTYIYIAIRRGPMKVPTTGTSVFSPNATAVSVGTKVTTGFPVDLQLAAFRDFEVNKYVLDRLRGVSTDSVDTSRTRRLLSNTTGAEATGSDTLFWDNTGFQNSSIFAGSNSIFWNFRRAPGFFDEVCFGATGQTNPAVNHNLGVAPEFIIHKPRSLNSQWTTAHVIDFSKNIVLNSTAASVTFPIVSNVNASTVNIDFGGLNSENATKVIYFFASAPGVSKVGSYTGTGTTQVINCGFTGGARFVLIKAFSTTGNWLVWDSARGIVAGNDPYLELNNTNAEVTNTDWVDTAATGFELSNAGGNLANSNGVSYIFLAIA